MSDMQVNIECNNVYPNMAALLTSFLSTMKEAPDHITNLFYNRCFNAWDMQAAFHGGRVLHLISHDLNCSSSIYFTPNPNFTGGELEAEFCPALDRMPCHSIKTLTYKMGETSVETCHEFFNSVTCSTDLIPEAASTTPFENLRYPLVALFVTVGAFFIRKCFRNNVSKSTTAWDKLGIIVSGIGICWLSFSPGPKI